MTCDCSSWPVETLLCEPVASDADAPNAAASAPRTPSYREIGGDMRRAAVHEAGHAIAAVATGEELFAVSIDPQPITLTFSHAPTLLSEMLRSAAGEICEGRWRGRVALPRKIEMMDRLRAARAGDRTICDRCAEAKALVAHRPELSDEALCEAWLCAFQVTADMFRHGTFCAAHDRLCAELLIRHTVDGAQAAQIIDTAALIAAKDAVLACWDLGNLK